MALITLNHVSKYYKNQCVVDAVSFEVHPGEVFGLLGENGAGKSTIMRMMLQLVRPSKGEIKQSNVRITGVIETPRFYNHLTGYENLEIVSRFSGKPNRTMIRDVVQMMGLLEFIEKKAGQYSLGMKQRLAIAQCLVNQADVIILDEPTNGLDPSGIIALRELIKELSAVQGKTFVISSHLLHEVEQVCHRVAFISKGHLVEIGDMRQLSASGQLESIYLNKIGANI